MSSNINPSNPPPSEIESLSPQSRVEHDVRIALQQSGYAAIRHIGYQLDGEELTLIGRVPSFHMKQVANTTVAKIQGVGVVFNLLEVT